MAGHQHTTANGYTALSLFSLATLVFCGQSETLTLIPKLFVYHPTQGILKEDYILKTNNKVTAIVRNVFLLNVVQK